MLSRRVYYELNLNNSKLTNKLLDYTKSITYTDVATNEADDISISLKKTIFNLKKYQKINVNIGTINWEKSNSDYKLNCGSFLIDSISLSGFPETNEIKAINAPINSNFMDTEHSRTWKNASTKTIITDIANQYGLAVYFDTNIDIIIELAEQDKKTDSSFTMELLSKYGYCMKIYNDKLVIYREEEYEKKTSVFTLKKNMIESYNIDDITSKTFYNKVCIEYKIGDSTKKYEYSTNSDSNKMLNISETANNINEAIYIAKSQLRKANKEQTKFNFSMIGFNKLVATNCIDIEDFESYNGKYFIDKITHSFGEGYTVDIECHKVLEGDY